MFNGWVKCSGPPCGQGSPGDFHPGQLQEYRTMTNAQIRVANAPCSWGIIENVEGERGGYARVLDEMRETGYAGTELGEWGFMPTEPRELRQELDRRNLNLLASWVTVHLHDAARLGTDEAD